MTKAKANKNFITKKTYQKLLKEKERLERELIKAQKEFGISRAGEGAWPGHAHAHDPYTQKIDLLIHKLNEIKKFLKDPVFITKKKGGQTVEIGTTVEIELEKEKRKLTILGSKEAESLNNVVSADSPLAKALIGHKVGDKVKIKVPSGASIVKITALE